MNDILKAIVEAGGNPIKVGGCIRDKLLGLDSKDVDVEVFGLSADVLCAVLRRFGKVSVVGASFGVIKLTTKGDDFDFSLPRRDSKTGRGHKGIKVEVDHRLTPKEAALRRDFTINAIGERLDGERVDPFGGEKDLRNRVLRATSEHFAEDPLRVLRGFQFASRFQLVADPGTVEMCRELIGEADTLALERIWGEWEKWGSKGMIPSLGLRFLVETGWVSLFPELANLIDVPQDPAWHPEGCAWTHTLHVCDAGARICDREGVQGEDRVMIILAALCHDLGKALPENGGTTVFEDGHWRSPGHAEAGVPLARRFLERIGCLERIIEKVLPLVAEHMICTTTSEITDRVVRRLAVRLGRATMRELLLILEADHSGRPPLPDGLPEPASDIAAIAERLALEASRPRPIIGGQHLIDRGYTPGPLFGKVIGACYEAQLDGIFLDEPGAVQHLELVLAEQ
jgi:tRNA nucleotidyltransferase (CCA-adding enzyme)